MDDRELLELAAKAAGYDVDWKEDGFYFGLGTYTPKYWNPLTDDGDALRLAVKLRLHIGLENSAVSVWDTGRLRNFQTEGFLHKDEYAATRRAIVRAAAEIGRTM